MLIGESTLTKRRRLGAVVVCVVLMAGLAMFWQVGGVAEAAVLDPHPGLVGWWRFDEGVGGVAEDSSGFGNDGTVYGATWVDGKHGKALSFDGTDDYVNVPSSNSLKPTRITLELWIKPYKIGAFEYVADTDGDSVQYGMCFQINSGFTGYYITFGNVGQDKYTAFALSEGIFYHFAFTYDGENIKTYVNGDLKSTFPIAGTPDIAWSTNPIRIGRIGTAASNWVKGIIDEVRIYNRDLSAAEIQESFQKRPDFSSKLLAKVPKGTTQVIVTLSWQGIGSIHITIESPSKSYTEDIVPVYQKTVYSTSGGTSSMLNIKRLAVSVTALSSDENWYVILQFNDVKDYRITVEVQK